MFLVDSHCHLNQLNYQDVHKNVSDVLKKAKQKGVQLVLSVSLTMSDYDDMVKLIGYRSDVVFSCGVHPTHIYNINNFDSEKLYVLSSKRNVVAIGETGLDYYHRLESDSKKKQKKAFREHIRVAKVAKKPIIVHSRDSCKDTVTLLRSEEAEECGGVLHCFSEDIDTARLLLNLNFYISFSGMITFTKSYMMQEVIKYVPSDRILLETDSPYLTPVPYRGQENQPAYIYEIAKYVASIKNINIDELAAITTSNFRTLFHLK
ncbi:YchF/TatD family DNA exonuclease [Blochmannia endosymbiont of Camponotus modoc]|uniref:YchF/TatD family DNA exonuclease n=1 Tax=Blochmannia endosymbiont of Camponotus modoc TaxID=2945587 RepID=UPI002024A3C7|nr:YchF/TatD family DNA exonuclease [Blochmannia endosymbiont of Camponotus modoc]URJ31574.1 YchF/TatD family DNA exonuclease [Blochmannia endosymbiont of Camponotus modoc]